jgi:hypothetical protein
LSHALESWGDARALDGTASLVQPLIRTLYDTRIGDELLALMANEPVRKAHDLVRATGTTQGGADFEGWWRQALHDGVIANTATAALTPPEAKLPNLPQAQPASGLTLTLAPHPSVWDGRFANNLPCRGVGT